MDLAAAVLWGATGASLLAQMDGIIVASIAAAASILNTLILARVRQTHKEVRTEIRKMINPVRKLSELNDDRERQIDELKGINRALSNRAIEFRESLENLRHNVREIGSGDHGN